ncbi:hypothetical protein PV326_000945 [Microctonus aethiopoides]|nr:hypothetical protein PV326_000945 [Microctonus aethiopoides]
MAGLIENSILLFTLIGVCIKLNTIVGGRDDLLDAFELLLNTDKYRIKCEETKKFDIDGEKKTSVQALTMSSFLSPEFIMVITYLACMLAQIFVLCWYANEVALNSLSIRTAVYNMDWYSLSLKTQKDLRLIIARASSPITFTGGPIVTLSLESFVNLIKLSYSAYNLLHQSTL